MTTISQAKARASGRIRRLLLAACTLVLVACASKQTPAHVDAALPVPIELQLHTTAGDSLEIATLRGRPVLLFLFATYDALSQAQTEPLHLLQRGHPELQLIGVAAQPKPRQLAAYWVDAIQPGFVVAYDPTDKLPHGESTLGAVPAIPAFIVLDASGMVRARVYGYQTASGLDQLLKLALRTKPR